MNKTVFLFSGQGSQSPGMGRELTERYSAAKRVYECGSDIVGFDLAKTCFEGDAQTLGQTKVSQPAIFATSLAALAAARENGVEPHAVAGHSLGEYAAMVACGMLSTEDGFGVIKQRAAAMQACAERQNSGMCAVLGLDSAAIAEVCETIEGYVVPVNFNSPVQTVIAGDAAAVDAAIAVFTEMGKRTARLQVNAAFHSKRMQPAADAFFAAIQGVSFAPPSLPFYSNVTGAQLTDCSDMPAYLARHLVSPVHFADELFALQADGFVNFVELGPGKVLTGLVKKTLKDGVAVNVENQKTLETMLAKLQ